MTTRFVFAALSVALVLTAIFAAITTKRHIANNAAAGTHKRL